MYRARQLPDEAQDGPVHSAAGAATVDRSGWREPWVQLKTYSYHPTIYPAMIRMAPPGARGGDLVTVYDKAGAVFGAGLYNPQARVRLRMSFHGEGPFGDDDFGRLLDRAAELRLDRLALPSMTDAFRVVHSDGDGLSGLVVDRFADVLSVEVHSLGVFQRLDGWMDGLHRRCETNRAVVEVDPGVARKEGIPLKKVRSEPVRTVLSREDAGLGKRKCGDLNRLALMLVEPGGLFVTCSCSGLVSAEEFEWLVIRAAHQAGKRLQFLDRTGTGEDHPVMSNCPESGYLKVLWARVIG